MPFISVFNYTGFMALIILLAGLSPSVLAQEKMHKHDDMKHQHMKKATQPATSGMQIDAAKLDFAAEKMTTADHFKVSIASQTTPVRINHMHDWVLTVKGHDGNPIFEAKINVDGGMPAHGHGLPTAPRVTRELGGGKYLVEGVRFNMGGHWELTFHIASANKSDKVTFNLLLN